MKVQKLGWLFAALCLAACSSPTDSKKSSSGGDTSGAFGIYSDAHTPSSTFEVSVGSNGDNAGVSYTEVTDAAAAFAGSHYLSIDFAQTEWGGAFFKLETPVTVSDFEDGVLVFSLNTTGIEDLANLEIKVASGTYPNEHGGTVDLSDLTPTVSGNWSTYKVPVRAFVDLTDALPDLSALTTYAGFWNPKDSEDVNATGTLLVDEVYFLPGNDLTLSSLAAENTSVSIAVGNTSTVHVATVYENGAVGLVDNADVTWSTESASVATVSAGVITAASAGSTTVTATYGGKELAFTVTVTEDLDPLGFYSETYTPTVTLSADHAQGNGSITVDLESTAVTALDGSKVISINKTGDAWGGAFFEASTDLDVSAYESLVFSLNKTAITALAGLTVKLQSGSTNTELNIKDYAGVTDGDWITYTIPLDDFSSTDLTQCDILGFWHPQDADDVNLTGTLYLDNIYFQPAEE